MKKHLIQHESHMDCPEIEIGKPNLNPRRAPVGFVVYKVEHSIFFSSSAICPSVNVHMYIHSSTIHATYPSTDSMAKQQTTN